MRASLLGRRGHALVVVGSARQVIGRGKPVLPHDAVEARGTVE